MAKLAQLFLTLALLTPFARAQFFGGGGGGDKATFAFCLDAPCATGTNVTNRYIVTARGKFEKCWISANVAPLTTPLTIDIKRNGVASVFTTKLSLPAGQQGPVSSTAFDSNNRLLDAGQFLTLDVTSVGTGTAGQDVTVSCTISPR